MTSSGSVRARTAGDGVHGRMEGMTWRWTTSHYGTWAWEDSAQAGGRRRTMKDCGEREREREREVEDKDILVIFKIYWMKKMTWMASRGKELHPNGIEGI
jgi:hypothetical protein